MENPFNVIHSEVMYRGRVLDVRRDQVRLPDGRTAQLDVVDHSGAVTMVPVDDDGQIWFIRQYRHPVQSFLLELPAGTLEEGEPADQAAHRELREEIGMASGELSHLGSFYLAPGYSTEFMHVFLARNLRADPLGADLDEFLTVESIPVRQAYTMVESGDLLDAKSLAALHLARPYLLGG